jgi:hypothetical protein
MCGRRLVKLFKDTYNQQMIEQDQELGGRDKVDTEILTCKYQGKAKKLGLVQKLVLVCLMLYMVQVIVEL